MITLSFSQGTEIPPTSAYAIASHLVVSNRKIDLFSPFAVDGLDVGERLPESIRVPTFKDSKKVFAGKTEVAGRLCEVECCANREGYRLRMGSNQVFVVAADGKFVGWLGGETGESRHDNPEDFLEPPLILALALQGIYCLHAGAVQMAQGAVAFIGDSGAGKSTLAGSFADDDSDSAQRLTDDLLPVTVDDDGPQALPGFPQRKLGESFRGSDNIPLTAIYLIDPPSGETAADVPVEIRPMSGADALLALVRHTVATRLLDTPALALHVEFCGRLAERVAVRRLRYVRRFEVLPRVRQEIRRDVQALAVR